ncbi:GATA transcription factor 7-like, partial [Phalaenopsis equestris]|uniref:GATA transcription factor 7-like n=1 Tax=Phalaenopsis equestris TaxID=78828 RepID=UPI0009E636AD
PPASNSTVLIPIKSKRSKRRRTKAALWSREPYFDSIPKKQGRKQRNLFAGNHGGGERQCTHCGVRRTPQWRAGPCGPKTLCNACGVRFKSGRLLPEYRPACSPTFISKVHSNSHREVLEMRRRKYEQS